MYIHDILNNEDVRNYLKYNSDYFREIDSFACALIMDINNDSDVLKYFEQFDYFFYIRSSGLNDYSKPKLIFASNNWTREEAVEMAPQSLIAGDLFKFNVEYKPEVNLNICPSGFNINRWVINSINNYDRDIFSELNYFYHEYFHFIPDENEFIIDDDEAKMSHGGLLSVFHKGRLIITNKRILFNDISKYDKDYSFEFKFDRNVKVIEKKKLLMDNLIFLVNGQEYELTETLSADKINEYKNELFKDN